MPVLDTCLVIDVLAGDPAAVRLLDLLRQQSAPLGVTPYTHFELYAGIGRSRRPIEETQKVEDFLATLTVFDFTPEAARLAGLLDARLAAEGRKASLVDLLIACIASHHGQDVVTRNAKDFEGLPGVRVLGY